MTVSARARAVIAHRARARPPHWRAPPPARAMRPAPTRPLGRMRARVARRPHWARARARIRARSWAGARAPHRAPTRRGRRGLARTCNARAPHARAHVPKRRGGRRPWISESVQHLFRATAKGARGGQEHHAPHAVAPAQSCRLPTTTPTPVLPESCCRIINSACKSIRAALRFKTNTHQPRWVPLGLRYNVHHRQRAPPSAVHCSCSTPAMHCLHTLLN